MRKGSGVEGLYRDGIVHLLQVLAVLKGASAHSIEDGVKGNPFQVLVVGKGLGHYRIDHIVEGKLLVGFRPEIVIQAGAPLVI